MQSVGLLVDRRYLSQQTKRSLNTVFTKAVCTVTKLVIFCFNCNCLLCSLNNVCNRLITQRSFTHISNPVLSVPYLVRSVGDLSLHVPVVYVATFSHGYVGKSTVRWFTIAVGSEERRRKATSPPDTLRRCSCPTHY